MITYIYGDLFQSPARVLVNPVNTVGVMGKGQPSEFKRYYPAMFEKYRTFCENDQLDIGQLYIERTPHKWIINFPIKRHWREKTRLDSLDAGLQKFAAIFAEQHITSVSFPAFAFDETGLDWQNDVRPLMESYLDPLPLAVYIHFDEPTARNASSRAIATWLNHVPQMVSFDKFWRDLLRLTRRKTQYTTLDGVSFTVKPGEKARTRSMILNVDGETLFLSESLLGDLWSYIRGAGYCLPENLPGGTDAYAAYIIAWFAELEYLQPIKLGLTGEVPRMGLHYISPVNKDAPRVVRFDEVVYD